MLYGLDWSTCQSELSEVEKKILAAGAYNTDC
jgi:hypothetical protein